MTPLAANLVALRDRYPAVAAVVEGLGGAPSRGEWSMARSGVPAVRRGGTWLTSAFDPVAEALKAVPPWDPGVDFAVVIGLGAGYLAEAVASRYPDLPLVVAEEDPAWLTEVLAHRDLSGLWSSGRVVPLLGPDARVIGEFFRPLACRTVELLSWRPLALLSPAWGGAVKAQVGESQAQARVNLATFGRFGDLWRRNLAKNEAHAPAVRPLTALTRWAEGVPAVVAAAGPGLADRLAWMKEHRDRFLLIAVDTAWSALCHHGLEPDVLLVLDGQYWNARHLDRPLPQKTLVVTEWIGPSRAFRLAPDRTYVAATSVPFLRARETARWGSLGALPSGGSVATAAWSLALHLGCPEVAFAGLDLGYPRGQTHVPGSQFEEAVHRQAHRLIPAETRGLGLRGWEGLVSRPSLDGGWVWSDPRMDLFRHWLSAAVARHPGVKAVNLGTRGSVVPGLEPAAVDYGHHWPRVALPPVPLSPPLRRGAGSLETPPFPHLAAVLSPASLADFNQALDRAWAVAREYWGTEVWDAWAGRAKTTWDRWPSARSRQAVEEVVSLALTWRRFLDLP